MAISNSIPPELVLQMQLRRLFNAGLITPEYIDAASIIELQNKFNTFIDSTAEQLFYQIIGTNKITEEYIMKWCKDWMMRMPFIFAYSLIYYHYDQKDNPAGPIKQNQKQNSRNETYKKYENKPKYRMISNQVSEQFMDTFSYKNIDKLSFEDHYQSQLDDNKNYIHDIPFTPKPIINKLNIKAKTQSNSLRIATLDISVYSLMDLDYIEKYFCSLGGRLFIQYGITTTDGIKNVYEFVQSTNYNSFGNATNASNYLNHSNLRASNKQGKGHYQSFIGIITNFSINVQPNGIYNISIQMYTQGICPVYARFSQIDTLQTQITQKIAVEYKNEFNTKYKIETDKNNKTIIKDITDPKKPKIVKTVAPKFKTLYDYITSDDIVVDASTVRSGVINLTNHNLTVNGQTYVSIYWIRQNILMKIFNKVREKISTSASNTNIESLLSYTKKLLYFDRFLSLPQNLISTIPQYVIFPTTTQLDFLNIDTDTQSSLCKFNFNTLKECISTMHNIEQYLISNSNINNKETAYSFIDEYLQQVLTRQIINTSPPAGYKYCNIGSTLINIKKIKTQVSSWGQNTKVDDLLRFIYDLLNTACGKIYTFCSYYNDQMDILILTQINKLQNTNNLDVYPISSIGKQSILRDLNLNIKLPDAMKTAAYIGSNVSADQSYKRMSMFWDSYNDIKSDYMTGMLHSRSNGFTALQSIRKEDNSTNNSDDSKKTSKQIISAFNALIDTKTKKYEWQKNSQNISQGASFKLKQQDQKTIITYFENQYINIQKQDIGVQSRLFPVSIDITLDLLTMIQWGMVFTIDNVPQRYRYVYDNETGKYYGTYWGVVQIQHSIDNTGATTKLRGDMFNIK